MIVRIALLAGLLGLIAFTVWHPAPKSPVAALALQSPPDSAGDATTRHPPHRRPGAEPSPGETVVYVAGAVAHPGLYRINPGDRYARAVALAGGMSAAADPAGVDLATHAADSDEIEVPVRGERVTHARTRISRTHHGRHRHAAPELSSVDLNTADETELANVPGIGRSVAARIVEMRERVGNFTSADQLLDVAGMTQSRMERARPYLRDP